MNVGGAGKGSGPRGVGSIVSRAITFGKRVMEQFMGKVTNRVGAGGREGDSGDVVQLGDRGIEVGVVGKASKFGGYSEGQMAIRESFDQLGTSDEVLEQRGDVVAQIRRESHVTMLLEVAADVEMAGYWDEAEGSDVGLLIDANLLDGKKNARAGELREALQGNLKGLELIRFVECKTRDEFEDWASTVDAAALMPMEGSLKGLEILMLDKALYERDQGYFDFAVKKMLGQGVSEACLSENGNAIEGTEFGG